MNNYIQPGGTITLAAPYDVPASTKSRAVR